MLVMTGCGDYQKLLKSHDPDLKYESALAYFNEGKYSKALTLLEDVSPYYKGTERAQEVITYLARSYMGQKQSTSAASYYEAYLRNYPKGRYAIEARFHIGHCYYLDAPDARLDQTDTRKGITAFTQFVELYPESPYAEQAYKEMAELYDRLAYKELLNAMEEAEGTDKVWSGARIKSYLVNEAYRGDILTHKWVKLDYLAGKQVPNKGQEEQFYLEQHHEPLCRSDRQALRGDGAVLQDLPGGSGEV